MPPAFWALCLFALFLQACSPAIEGCTDPRARNFNAAADRDCCCEFFQWQWTLGHAFDENEPSFQFNSPFADAQGTGVEFLYFDLFVSDLALLDAQGQVYLPEDSTSYFTFGNNTRQLTNNLAAINPEYRLIRFGKFGREGTYTQMRVVLGLNEVWRLVNPERILNNPTHPLKNTRLYNDTTRLYTDARIGLKVTNTNSIYDFNYSLGDTLYLDLNQGFDVQEGQDANLRLEIHYGELFHNINFATEDEVQIQAKIKANLGRIFKFL